MPIDEQQDLSSLFGDEAPPPQESTPPPQPSPQPFSPPIPTPPSGSQVASTPREKLIKLLEERMNAPDDPLDNYSKIMEKLKQEKTPSQRTQDIHQQIYGRGLKGSFNEILNAAGNVGNKDYKGTWDPILEQQNKEETERQSMLKSLMPLYQQRSSEQKVITKGMIDALRDVGKDDANTARNAARLVEVKRRNDITELRNRDKAAHEKAILKHMEDTGVRDPVQYAHEQATTEDENGKKSFDPRKFAEVFDDVQKSINKYKPVWSSPERQKITPDMLKKAAEEIHNDPDNAKSYQSEMPFLAPVYRQMYGHNPPHALGEAEITAKHNAGNTLDHVAAVKKYIEDNPELLKRIGAVKGRLGDVEAITGDTVGLSSTEAAKVAEMRNLFQQMFLREVKSMTTGRPAYQVLADLKKVSARSKESVSQIMGELAGTDYASRITLRNFEKSQHGDDMRTDFEDRLEKSHPSPFKGSPLDTPAGGKKRVTSPSSDKTIENLQSQGYKIIQEIK